jgi:very-short-patch-repair endonuclease
MSGYSEGEEKLMLEMRALKLPLPLRQYYFDCEEPWMTDFCWLQYKLIVEVDGGLGVCWKASRKGRKVPYTGDHTSRDGYTKDRKRDRAAAKAGFTVIRVTPDLIKKGIAIRWIEEYLLGQ